MKWRVGITTIEVAGGRVVRRQNTTCDNKHEHKHHRDHPVAPTCPCSFSRSHVVRVLQSREEHDDNANCPAIGDARARDRTDGARLRCRDWWISESSNSMFRPLHCPLQNRLQNRCQATCGPLSYGGSCFAGRPTAPCSHHGNDTARPPKPVISFAHLDKMDIGVVTMLGGSAAGQVAYSSASVGRMSAAISGSASAVRSFPRCRFARTANAAMLIWAAWRGDQI
jgi:hypothetical protein